jgi:type IV pilus assembly protein PilZ
MDESQQDRRINPRHTIELQVEYKRLNSFFADYTKNISQGGTFICTDRPLDAGTEFLFKLIVPTLNRPLILHGKVHWTVSPEEAKDDQPAGMGIGFIYKSEADRRTVENEVERLMVSSLGRVLYDKLIGDRRKR